MFLLLLATLSIRLGIASATPVARTAAPTVTLDSATFTGVTSGTTSQFLGIPFAQPPTGDLRFRLPQTIAAYNGTQDATAYGLACPQQAIDLPVMTGLAADAVDFIVNSVYGVVFPDSEDCLYINVIKPTTTTTSSKLPVAVWIFGGGFELGDPTLYDGSAIVKRSITLGEPIIYVSMNYRVSGFGFLASQEVKEAGVGNLGLQDQREALRWVQKYIGQFGGDPTKVTIWGESAGAISVALQMVTNGGDAEGLFRGGFMESGSPIPVGDFSHGQKYYDAIVEETGCSGSSDTLACLRTVEYDTLKAAIDNSPGIFAYQSLVLAWLPRVDGVFLTDAPQTLVQQGSVANIPFVNGDNDDEGTLFALSTLNITTDAEFKTYISTYWLPDAPMSDTEALMTHYTNSITAGSPFDTLILNALTPQFKRMAAFVGDAVFQAPRRFFINQVASKQKVWSYLSKRLKVLPVLGSVHVSDILNVYGGGEMEDYLINFVNNLDPNGQSHLKWPQYTTSSPKLMTFQDGLIPLQITKDTYRADAITYLQNLTLTYPL